MSEYIVSARKYRPMTFDSVVGQSSLTTTLKNAVSSGKLAHAYLFCGPRGVGKTTCARIFAKVINCLTPTASGDACGQCESCRAFDEGRSLNIFELDAASNNGVEQIKNLMDQTRIPPQTGRYKVFIIDEVHMLSTAAFNAFLKTLEEPPAHVIFILATTEKHKILPTIISRCQIYDFERMTVQGIIGHLKHVADSEGIAYEEEALSVIAEKADGGMRDALSIFDQAASFCQGNITYQKVIDDLNVLDADHYFKLVDDCLANNVSEVMVTLGGILQRGFDGGHLVNGLAAHVRNVMMAQQPATTQLIEASDQQRQRYAEQAARCTTKFLYGALKLLQQCDLDYRQSNNKRLLVELTLIQVAQLTQPEDAEVPSGPRPCKRLKRLFKLLMTDTVAAGAASASRPQGAAQSTSASAGRPLATNHAAEAPAIAPAEAAPTVGAGQSAAAQPVATVSNSAPAGPRLKLSQLSNSFHNILHGNEKQANQQVAVALGHAENEHEQFEEDDLRREWLAMCKRMQQNRDYAVLGTRMQNVQVRITDFPNVEGLCENQLLLQDVQAIRQRVEVTLAQRLHNGALKFTLRQAESREMVRRLTPREFLQKIVEEDPVFVRLQKDLQLELE